MDLQRKVVIKEGVVPPRKTRQGLRGRKHNFLDDVNYGQYAACGKLSKKDYTRLSAAVRYFNHTNEVIIENSDAYKHVVQNGFC